MRVRLMTVIAAGSVSILLAGCGSGSADKADTARVTGSAAPTSKAPTPAGKVAVTKAGFGADSYGSAMAVAEVSNPTSEIVEIQVNFAAYDAAGKVLDTESGGNVLVRTHGQQVVATDLSLPDHAKIDHIDAQVTVGDSKQDDHPESKMTIASPQVRAQSYGGYTATGLIDSTYTDTVTNVYAAAMCLNAAGKIVGGGYTFLDANVVGGGKTPIKVSLTVSKKPASCLVTATPSNISDTA